MRGSRLIRKINISTIYIIIASLILSGATSWIILKVLTPIFNVYHDYINFIINGTTIGIFTLILVVMCLFVFIKNTPKIYDLTLTILLFIFEIITITYNNKFEIIDFILITMLYVVSLLMLKNNITKNKGV